MASSTSLSKWLKNSIWHVGGALTVHSGPGSNGNEWILQISQSFWTQTSPSDDLASYTRHSFYPSTEMQLAYSIVPADSAKQLTGNVAYPFVTEWQLKLKIKRKKKQEQKKKNE